MIKFYLIKPAGSHTPACNIWGETAHSCLVCFDTYNDSHKKVSWMLCIFLYPRPTKLEGGYTGFTLSVRLSVCPSVRLSVDDMVSGA